MSKANECVGYPLQALGVKDNSPSPFRSEDKQRGNSDNYVGYGNKSTASSQKKSDIYSTSYPSYVTSTPSNNYGQKASNAPNSSSDRSYSVSWHQDLANFTGPNTKTADPGRNPATSNDYGTFYGGHGVDYESGTGKVSYSSCHDTDRDFTADRQSYSSRDCVSQVISEKRSQNDDDFDYGAEYGKPCETEDSTIRTQLYQPTLDPSTNRPNQSFKDYGNAYSKW